MSSRKFFSVPEHGSLRAGVLLLIRVVAGAAFMIHGWGKIQNPLGWMGDPEHDIGGVIREGGLFDLKIDLAYIQLFPGTDLFRMKS